MAHQSFTCARAEALFVSPLSLMGDQPPPADEVKREIAASVRRHGVHGCAALMAAEFGEHPETAESRMSAALAAVRAVYS